MPYQRQLFEDFHDHGASAPEWNQRYAQLSRGQMRSRLTEVRTDGLHIFRKWMSERVAQEGCLPPGRICFAMLARPVGETPRMQGQELLGNRLVVVRQGDQFALQRPRGMDLLAVTFGAEEFRRLCDETRWSRDAKALLARSAIDCQADSLIRLRGLLERVSRHASNEESILPNVSASRIVFDALTDVFDAAVASRRSVGGGTASAIVARCHAIVLASGDAPPGIEELCTRLRTSRRTLQNSFQAVADTTPVDYLRSLRLNAVRKQLVTARPGEISVTQAALARGFGHLGRFSAEYRALFGELPSESVRRAGLPAHKARGG